MTYLEDLITTRDQMAAILVEITADPKPSYSIDGQTVQWSAYFRMLTDKLEAINNLLAGADPGEVQSIGFT